MKVLIMGGRRFVGKQLAKNLIDLGHEVTIANRSGNNEIEEVKNVVFDRNSSESLCTLLKKEQYDVIYDMICYSHSNARDIVECLSCNKYIMISSSTVYDGGIDLYESKFDAENYEAVEGDITLLQKEFGFAQAYKLGKRGAESVIAKLDRGFNTIRVRFPIIMGFDDHTKRMENLFRNVFMEEPVYIDNIDSRWSVINAINAAEYLAKLITIDCKGAINMCDGGIISVREILEMISHITGKEVKYSKEGVPSGYNGYNTYILDSEKMCRSGVKQSNLSGWIHDYMKRMCL